MIMISKFQNTARKYILWGATGQAKVLRETLSKMELLAVFDNNSEISSPFEDVPLFIGESRFIEWFNSRDKNEEIGFLVAIGGDKGKDRLEIQNKLESYGLHPLVAVHSHAFVAQNADIGTGSQILANAVVCVEGNIGKACIINTGASLDHESTIGDGVHLCPGARLAGMVHVDNFATIYSGAIVIPRIKIGEGAIVGAGSVVLDDVPPYVMVVGNPARIIRKINGVEGSK
jgi:sugar O-acyltransferase (sialic acid O-acetyltransferase NeuD family)